MILEMKIPRASDWASLAPMVPVLFTYALSFVYLGIYWANHHHMFHTTTTVTGGILWANLHLLFWLSLVPATTEWIDATHYAAIPTALYGIVLLMAAAAYTLLELLIIRSQGPASLLRRAIGNEWKGKLSVVLYATAVVSALRWPYVAVALYALVALLWLVPDRRIERLLSASAK